MTDAGRRRDTEGHTTGGAVADHVVVPDAWPEWLRRASVDLAKAVAWRPWLWPVATAEMLRMARSGWWRSWPPLPSPDPKFWRFRVQTVYGGAGDVAPPPQDIRSFLSWCRDARRWRAG